MCCDRVVRWLFIERERGAKWVWGLTICYVTSSAKVFRTASLLCDVVKFILYDSQLLFTVHCRTRLSLLCSVHVQGAPCFAVQCTAFSKRIDLRSEHLLF